jgi:hypothetical protein
MPEALRASLTPATSGASGPIITRSDECSVAQVVTAVGSLGFRGTQVTSWLIPPLPGAQLMFSGAVPVRIRALMMACSRAPAPKTKIFIRSSLSVLALSQGGLWFLKVS